MAVRARGAGGRFATNQVSLEFETAGFERWVKDFTQDMERDATRKALRRIAKEFIERVVPRTPVDTGRARRGWVSFLVQTRDAGGRFITPDRKTVRGSSKALEEPGRFKESFGNLNDQFIEIVNGVPYIVRLEFGHSKQAPSGMVRITFREMASQGIAPKIMGEEMEAAAKRTNKRHPATRTA